MPPLADMVVVGYRAPTAPFGRVAGETVSGVGLINRVRLFINGTGIVESVTVMVPVPTAVGVPERTPVAGLNDRPAGRPVACKVYGEVPPEALMVTVGYKVPTVPGFRLAGLITNAELIVTVRVAVCGEVAESLTVIVPVPEPVGVPLSTPEVVLNVRPAGNPDDEST